MKNSFWGLIWSSFNKIQGTLIGILGFLGSILLIRFPFKTSIPLDLVIIVSFFTLLLVATLLVAINEILRKNRKLESEASKLQEVNQKLETEIKQRVIPKILRIQKGTNNNIVCLLEASDLFATGMMLSFYYTHEDDFERLIGLGYVKNIQNDGKIQAIIDQIDSNYQSILDKLVNNDFKVLTKTVVRLGIPKDFNQP